MLLAIVLTVWCRDEPVQPAVIRYLHSLGPHSYPPRYIHSPPQRRVYERAAQEFGLTNIIPLFNTYRFFSVVLSVSMWPKCWLKNGGARLHGSCWLKQSIVKSAMCYASKLCHRVKRSFLNSLERTILPSLLRRCTAIVTPTAATQHYLK